MPPDHRINCLAHMGWVASRSHLAPSNLDQSGAQKHDGLRAKDWMRTNYAIGPDQPVQGSLWRTSCAKQRERLQAWPHESGGPVVLLR